jgi:hypothetical protein
MVSCARILVLEFEATIAVQGTIFVLLEVCFMNESDLADSAIVFAFQAFKMLLEMR